MTGLSRRERERQSRREAILDAAERVYRLKGPQATVDEIAEAAEVAKGTVYLYFTRKDDLFLLVICRGLDLLAGYLREVFDRHLPPDETIREYGEAFIRFHEDHPEFYRLLMDLNYPLVNATVSDEVYEELARHSTTLWSTIIITIEAGIDAGIFRADLKPFEVAVLLWSNLNGMLRIWDYLKRSTVWQQNESPYSFAQLRFPDTLSTANALLLDAIRRR